MKKSLYIIFAALVAAAACTSFKEEASLPVVNPSTPKIVIMETGETSFRAKVSVDDDISFWSYAVMTGKPAQLDSTTLFKQGYKSKSFAYGTKERDDIHSQFELVIGSDEKPLTRNADYTIYVVAASKQGTVGSVVYAPVHTADEQAPKIASASNEENVMTLGFSEAVSYNDAKPVTVKYYAPKLTALNAGKDDLAETGEMGDASASVAVSGNKAVVTVTLADGKALPAGAYYAVSYPDGAFVDMVGNAIKGLSSGPVAKDGKLAWSGAVGDISNAPFSLIDDDAKAATVAPSKQYFTFSIPEGVTILDATKNAEATMEVVAESSAVQSQSTYTLEYNFDWAYLENMNAVLLQYPDGINIIGGNKLTISIAEGSFMDIYGNTNAAISHLYLYSYGYTLEDIVGTYTYTGSSYWGARYDEEDEMVIEESDDPEAGDVMFTKIYGMECDAPVYASFDTDGGIINIVDWQPFAAYEDGDDAGYLYFAVNGDDVNLEMKEAGVLSNPSAWFGYYGVSTVDQANNSGWWNLFTVFEAVRNGGVPAPETASKKKVSKPVSIFKAL